jgi:FO synthase
VSDAAQQALWAVMPVKRLIVGKRRLASVLADQREEFARTLAGRTIQTVIDSQQFRGILVVTPDPLVALDAKARGAVVLDDGGGSLNAACVLGSRAAVERGAEVCVLIPADLALLTPSGLARLVGDYRDLTTRHGRDAVGLIRCKEGSGTNMVFFGRQQPFSPEFGPDSFTAHLRGAAQPVYELSSEEAAFDVDTAEDFRLLSERQATLPANDPIARFLTSLENPAVPFRPQHAAQFLIDAPVTELTAAARVLRDRQHGSLVTYSRKVFIPLTQLCRDVCHYCTFAKAPKEVAAAYLSVDEVLAVAEQGAKLECKEALFTLGEKPEMRHRAAREWLAAHGFSTTLEYLAHAAAAVRDRSGLLPHINAGCMSAAEMATLRPVSASMGLMLESAAERLCEKGGPHYGSPDKHPSVRLATIAEAGRQKIPFTTGILIGIGETRAERIDALLAIRELHDRYGHIQEIIIQNFVPKPHTAMTKCAAPSAEELIWTIAVARILFGQSMSIQAPPNLSPVALPALIDAGINDWGGVSPLTRDFVNPEAPWPEIERLKGETAVAGKLLAERLTIYPAYAMAPEWLDPKMRRAVLEQSDGSALGRENSWRAGRSLNIPGGTPTGRRNVNPSRLALLVDEIRERGTNHLDIPTWASLFEARGADFEHLCATADDMRSAANGETLTYVVNRNINYTNICSYRCTFCAFSKGTRKHEGAERPYLLDLDVLADRVREARERGATEVCLQGGIHPDFTGRTYLEILRTVKRVDPSMHVHAFSPLEVWHGATTLGLPLKEYLSQLRDDGLGSLPGTAAEILHDPVRKLICPDKLTTEQWLTVVGTAHAVGLRTTSTIMFGHLDRYTDWAIHLMRLRDLQRQTGGFTEFVPLPFVAHEAPMYKRGHARPGPTLREALLMHAVARLTLAPEFVNIQTSWVKMGHAGVREALQAGANDLGGTLMNESISRAAGALHGQEMTVGEMHDLAASLGRRPTRRTTLYGQPKPDDAGQHRICDRRTADDSRPLRQIA